MYIYVWCVKYWPRIGPITTYSYTTASSSRTRGFDSHEIQKSIYRSSNKRLPRDADCL